MAIASAADISSDLRREAAQVNEALGRRLEAYTGPCPRLAEAMRYSIQAGGKRLRPTLVLWSCDLCGGDRKRAWPAALAVECVHTFSLIHDDLPAIDNDDLRRGRPTSHVRFGEALAVLAGDGLLALAFEVLARETPDRLLAAEMIAELAAASGWEGMIGGEAADVEGERLPPDVALVSRIHQAKTARLLEAACALGAMAVGAAGQTTADLRRYGRSLGLAFQAVDDLLDVTAATDQVGKRTGKDAAAHKQTYPQIVGVNETRRLAETAVAEAAAALAPFGNAAARLTALARYVLDRHS